MMRRGGLVLAGVLAVGVLGPACAPSEKDPVVTVSAAEPHINDAGASTTLTITVLDEAARKGTGVVRVTTKVGMFGEEGNNTLVTLSDGSATVPFTCPVARDSACALGVASVSADWRGNVGRGKVYVGERGLLLLQGKTGTTVPPPTSGGGNPTETGTFSTFVSSQVYLHASLHQSTAGAHALSSLTQPMRLFVGFPFQHKVSMGPNGEIFHSVNSQLYRATLDEFVQDGMGTAYPSDPLGNDTLLPTPCTTGVLVRFSVHPTSGEVFYQCAVSGNSDISGGTEIKNQATGAVAVPADDTKGYSLIKMGYGGTKLVTDKFRYGVNLFLLDSNNVAKRVDLASNPDTTYLQEHSSRARPDGFYMIYWDRVADVLQLWRLSTTGIWSRVGIYAGREKLPTGYYVPFNHFVLDGNNNAYAIVSSGTAGYGVARFPLGGGTPSIIYMEKNRPAEAGWQNWPPKLYNTVHANANAYLVTGP